LELLGDLFLHLDWKALIAIYAAVLSTVVFVWNIRISRGRLRVQILHGAEEVDDGIVHGVYVSIQNPSHKPVYVRHASVLYPSVSSTFFGRLLHLLKYRRWSRSAGWVHTSPSYEEIMTDLPKTIQPGDSCGFIMDKQKLLRLVEGRKQGILRVSVQDALWRTTYSNIMEYS
jgi:hypothetical protein